MEFVNKLSDLEEGEIVSSSDDEFCDTKDQPSGDFFCIDTIPTNEERLSEARSSLYHKMARDEVLPVPKERKRDDDETTRSEKFVSCFNCMGNHFLRNCPKKYNHRRVMRNKDKLRVSSEPSVRYHQSTVIRKSSGRPGHISEPLREALGLRSDQLPMHIYHMRVLGYPPGWLKQAEIESSSLTIYDNVQKDSEKWLKAEEAHDLDKLIKYPGYNTSVPEGVIDEWKELGMPPQRRSQQLSKTARKESSSLSAERGRKRKREESSASKRKKVKQENDASMADCGSKTSLSVTSVLSSAASHRENPSPKGNGVLSSTLGATVDYGNPIKKLPDLAKFSHGISEHLPFENLPGATDNFEKMRSVLKSIKERSKNGR